MVRLLVFVTTASMLCSWICAYEPKGDTEDAPMVNISTGIVRGSWEVSKASKKRVQTFLGIPYAIPPLGELRFKPPVAAKLWDGVFDATKTPKICVQKKLPIRVSPQHLLKFFPSTNSQISEDCLTLNVYVPEGIKTKTPVVVWIYGGGHSRGASLIEFVNGVTFSAETDVITVLFNYRLTFFGLLYFDHPEAPGNVALMDQLLVLKWVRQNIEAFGGDPEQVTLAGYSSGAACVGLQMLIPESQNLFQRAILESGSPQNAFATESKKVVMEKGLELASNVGCPSSPSNISAVIECLREKDASELLDNQPQHEYDHIYIFRPVVDGKFIRDHPYHLIKNKTFLASIKKDIISGTDKDESSLFLSAFNPLSFQIVRNRVKTNWQEIRSLMSEYFGMTGVTNDVLVALYDNRNSNQGSQDLVTTTVKIGSDVVFTCPSAQFERALTEIGSKVYKYFFVHRPSDLSDKGVPAWVGTHHNLELIYVFGDRLSSEYPPAEIQFAKRIMKYWGNFIKTGDPNKALTGKKEEFHWPQHTSENEEYVVLAPNASMAGRFLRRKNCIFWDDVIPTLMKLQENSARGYFHIAPEI